MRPSAIDPRLETCLRTLNAARLRGTGCAVTLNEAALEDEIHRANNRIAVYGTLSPGKSNNARMNKYGGVWSTGVVRGKLHESGWGASLGSPGMSWKPSGIEIKVAMLESKRLADAWSELDDFEGAEYVRILVPVEQEERVVVANIYALRKEMVCASL